MKMNPEVKAKWVAALRSGEYKQGTDHLRTNAGCFCCLGVLVDIYAKGHGMTFGQVHDAREDNDLPNADVCAWAALSCDNPPLKINEGVKQASDHNDGNGCDPKTFAQIADAIEAQL